MLTRGSRPRALAAAAVVVSVLVSGCGSSDAESAEGGSGSSTSASGPSSESSSESSSGSDSPTPVPGLPTTYPAADGPLIKVPGASMHALRSYHHISDFGIVQGWGDGQSSVTFVPEVNRAKSLEAMERNWVRRHGGYDVQVKQEDGVAGGKYRAWHVLDSTSDPDEQVHTFGILFLESAWLISIKTYDEGFPEPLTEEEQQEVIGRLLASFKTDLD
ncbi:hypothetical protein [Nocardioides zeicaulis]|uniref:DUF1795 domain-containing protein n=1 Tax=Nocardioides zeicaulis TaxID=1776857 RepID=A0ABV6E6D9_9ACTN